MTIRNLVCFMTVQCLSDSEFVYIFAKVPIFVTLISERTETFLRGTLQGAIVCSTFQNMEKGSFL